MTSSVAVCGFSTTFYVMCLKLLGSLPREEVSENKAQNENNVYPGKNIVQVGYELVRFTTIVRIYIAYAQTDTGKSLLKQCRQVSALPSLGHPVPLLYIREALFKLACQPRQNASDMHNGSCNDNGKLQTSAETFFFPVPGKKLSTYVTDTDKPVSEVQN